MTVIITTYVAPVSSMLLNNTLYTQSQQGNSISVETPQRITTKRESWRIFEVDFESSLIRLSETERRRQHTGPKPNDSSRDLQKQT